MARLLFLVLAVVVVLSSSWSASAVDLRGAISWNEKCADMADLGPTKVVLDRGKYFGSVVKSGNFVIPEVPPGIYVLSVLAHNHIFDNLRIDISDDKEREQPVSVHPYILGTPFDSSLNVTLPYPPLLLVPRAKLDYFAEPESFSVLAMLRNPLVLIMVVMLPVSFAMPYIMKNLDPETAQELQRRQAKVIKLQNSIQSGDIREGLAAMLPNDSPRTGDAAASGSTNTSSPATQARNRKGKRK